MNQNDANFGAENSHAHRRASRKYNGFSCSHEFNRLQNSMIIPNSCRFIFTRFKSFPSDHTECFDLYTLAFEIFNVTRRKNIEDSCCDHPPPLTLASRTKCNFLAFQSRCTNKSLRLITIVYCLRKLNGSLFVVRRVLFAMFQKKTPRTIAGWTLNWSTRTEWTS